MGALYPIGLFLLVTAAVVHYRQSDASYMIPVRRTRLMAIYDFLGGPGNTIALAIGLVLGFAAFVWWFPLVALVAAALAAILVYGVARYLAALVVMTGTPVGLAIVLFAVM